MRVGGQRTPNDRTAARVPSDAPRITVTFEDRSYRIEQDRAELVARFVSENKATDKTDVVTVDAYAFTGEGALSEARRLAYYRAMTARKQLVDAKVPAENIRINVLDTTEKNKGSTVEIAVGGSAKQ
jgi:hypothetical protein